jgi:uncharacterized RmlC-like cupin family protein
MGRPRGSAGKLETFVRGIHYVAAAAAGRRSATKRVIHPSELVWEDNLHGRSAYVVDSVTGFASRNLAMFIREIPARAATGTHHHNFEAVAYVLEGRGHDIHDGKVVRWRKGDALYIPPLVEHQHVNDEQDQSAWLLFVTNWPMLNYLGVTTFVQTAEAPRDRTARAPRSRARRDRTRRARPRRGAPRGRG